MQKNMEEKFGFYYNDNFYEDENFTILMKKEKNKYYIDFNTDDVYIVKNNKYKKLLFDHDTIHDRSYILRHLIILILIVIIRIICILIR